MSIAEKTVVLPKGTFVSRWIPVSERLPNIKNYTDFYLVTLSNGHVCICQFVETQGKHWWVDFFDEDVIAWMPLPPCYEP